MNLLQISMAIHDLPVIHLLVIALFVGIAAAFVIIFGIPIKLMDKECVIGGFKSLFARRDADMALKEQLKKQIDDIDTEMIADVTDLIESMNSRLESVLINKHCYFTLDKFIGIIKKELYKRVRRNNLKVKLCEQNRDKYVSKILDDVRERYQVLQAKALAAQCQDRYGDFTLIQDEARKEITYFSDEAKRLVILRLREKMAAYEKAQDQFQIQELRKQSCEIPLQKNRAYIAKLEAV